MKTKIAVLFGGQNCEHEISLESAASVIQNLDKDKFEIIPIAIDHDGRWLLHNYEDLKYTQDNKVIINPNARLLNLPLWEDTGLKQLFDVIFPVLHGRYVEDGCFQGLFELWKMPYVGCNVISSAMCMDKGISKKIAKEYGIPVPHFQVFNHSEWGSDQELIIDRIQDEINFPVFVKPINTGSSIGVNKAHNQDELIAAINQAFLIDSQVIVEQSIEGREIELAVLENNTPLVSIAGEIIPRGEFYSYESKYLDADGAALCIPAKLTDEQLRDAQSMAIKCFEALGCHGLARVDLLLDTKTNKFYFNEANTLPGFTSISMYPKLWAHSGLQYSELLTRLINLAQSRHAKQQTLLTDYQQLMQETAKELA